MVKSKSAFPELGAKIPPSPPIVASPSPTLKPAVWGRAVSSPASHYKLASGGDPDPFSLDSTIAAATAKAVATEQKKTKGGKSKKTQIAVFGTGGTRGSR
jgi:hypothetical protein